MSVKKYIYKSAMLVPPVRGVFDRLHLAEYEVWTMKNSPVFKYRWFVQPGHYYSPLVNLRDKYIRYGSVDGPVAEVELKGINLNTENQLYLLEKLSKYFDQFPYFKKAGRTKEQRFDLLNDQFGIVDALVLFCMLRHFSPKNIIEIGSGWSSALMLDTAETYDMQTNFTFIEPYPERLLSALYKSDLKKVKVVPKKIQAVDLKVFDKLDAGDLLFIDSSHVSKSGSDVNLIYFDILPRLKKGVLIHIHDIFYPFEYIKDWIQEGRNWNEAYILRALLMDNQTYEIVFWENYLDSTHQNVVKKRMPKLARVSGGGGIWLRKTG